jgi:hypothetical protein
VEGAFCRDVRPDQVSEVAEALGEWLDAANSVLGGIEERIDWTLSATTAADKARGEAQQALETERKSIRTTIEMQVGDTGAAGGECLQHARPGEGKGEGLTWRLLAYGSRAALSMRPAMPASPQPVPDPDLCLPACLCLCVLVCAGSRRRQQRHVHG